MIRPDIVEAVRHITLNKISLIEGPTGSGKSLLIPGYLAQSEAIYHHQVIMVALPTIQAVKGLYARASSDQAKNYSVGYSANRIIRYDLNRDTLIYATSGHIRRFLASFFRNGAFKPSQLQTLTKIKYLIVDEVHTGSVDNSMIMGLWSALFSQLNDAAPSLVLMSATIAGLPRIFGNLNPFRLRMKSFPVEVKYLEHDPKDNHEAVELAVDEALKYHRANKKQNNIIIFVAGIHDIENAQKFFAQSDRPNQDFNYTVVTVHGSIKRSRHGQESDKRLIYITTNALESSVTIENVAFVIDTMYEKRPSATTNHGIKLKLTKISKNSADQRRGRTGRMMPGICLRLITEQSFQKLEQARPIDIYLVPIYSEVLSIMATGLPPDYVISGGSDDAEVKKIVEQAKKYLLSLQLIDRDGNVKNKAPFLSSLTIGLKSGMVMVGWFERLIELGADTLDMRQYYFGILVGCLIDDDPRTYVDDVERYKKFLGRNDLETLINMWYDLMLELEFRLDRKDAYQLIRTWSRFNGFKADAIEQLVRTFRDCVTAVDANYYKPSVGPNAKKFNPMSAADIALMDLELDIMNDVIFIVYYNDIMTTSEGKNHQVILRRKGERVKNFLNVKGLMPQMSPLNEQPFKSQQIVPLSYYYLDNRGSLQVVTPISINSYIAREKFSHEEEDERSTESFEGFTGVDMSAFD